MQRSKRNGHLTLEGRKFIEEELNDETSVKEIAEKLNRDRTSIADEILNNRTKIIPSSFGETCTCIHQKTCKIKKYGCERTCNNYQMEICIKLKTSPHVCNSCKYKQCRKVKHYYRGKDANTQYLNRLTNSRNKLHYTEEELKVLNNDFYCLVIVNKSIYHSLIVINSRGYNFNIKSIYRQIKTGRLRLKSSDLPRANTDSNKETVDKSYKRNIIGHTYENYKLVIEANPDITEWQMDCVQGIIGKNEQVFLTLQIVKIKFLFIFPIKAQTQDEVASKLKKFNGILKKDSLNKLIELLLTDNGHEFIDLDRLIEILGTDNIFYCHPYSSCEKGSIENNHELIRRVIPQGVSLNAYTEEDIKMLCSNINSLCREELGGKCPFDLVDEYISKETMEKIGYKQINADDVILVPELLGEKNINNIKRYLDDKDINKANISFITDEDVLDSITRKIFKYKLK